MIIFEIWVVVCYIVSTHLLSRGNTTFFFYKSSHQHFHGKFLVNTGANVSILPCKSSSSKAINPNPLYATNDTRIPTFDSKELTLGFGLHRLFSWSFLLADVKKPILGADFFQHYGLLVEIKNCRLIDRLTSISDKSSSAHEPSFGLKILSDCFPYHKLLDQFSSFTNPAFLGIIYGKHDVIQCILKKGRSIFV
ncbi:uncharacterized protein TNIN_201691 [Trichonephila inaurata madagascariensis]|uniref:Peptidase A2 domain-containing protein n=1 Tax=Trichonephila inaurata madagascariensis TaxID=2747483 RepID=A0A8X6M9J2_9ARAC|nr:uncharacterized protein TNIN_201691 [Trichonephila inaurata madagascariensis]